MLFMSVWNARSRDWLLTNGRAKYWVFESQYIPRDAGYTKADLHEFGREFTMVARHHSIYENDSFVPLFKAQPLLMQRFAELQPPVTFATRQDLIHLAELSTKHRRKVRQSWFKVVLPPEVLATWSPEVVCAQMCFTNETTHDDAKWPGSPKPDRAATIIVGYKAFTGHSRHPIDFSLCGYFKRPMGEWPFFLYHYTRWSKWREDSINEKGLVAGEFAQDGKSVVRNTLYFSGLSQQEAGAGSDDITYSCHTNAYVAPNFGMHGVPHRYPHPGDLEIVVDVDKAQAEGINFWQIPTLAWNSEGKAIPRHCFTMNRIVKKYHKDGTVYHDSIPIETKSVKAARSRTVETEQGASDVSASSANFVSEEMRQMQRTYDAHKYSKITNQSAEKTDDQLLAEAQAVLQKKDDEALAAEKNSKVTRDKDGIFIKDKNTDIEHSWEIARFQPFIMTISIQECAIIQDTNGLIITNRQHG